MLKATHDVEERREQLDQTIEQMNVRLARLDAGLQKLGDIEAMHGPLDKLERQRRDEFAAIHKRLDASQASLEDLDARCKATHSRIKRRQEVFADQLTVR